MVELKNNPNELLTNFEQYHNNTIEEIELLMRGTTEVEGDKYLSQLYYEGSSFIYKEEFTQVLKIGEKLLEYSKLLKNNHYETKAYNLIGIAKLNSFLYKEALYYFKKGITISEDIRTKAAIYLNISEIYIRLEKYDKSMDCINEVIDLAKEIAYERLIFKATIKRSELMLINGDVTLAKVNFDSINSLISDKLTSIDLYYMYLVKGKIHSKQVEFQQALINFKKAEEITTALGMKKLNVLVWHNLAEIYIQIKDLDQSLSYAKKAYTLSLELEDIHYRCNACQMISKIYEDKEDVKLAFEYLKKTLSYKSIMTTQMFSFDDEVSNLIVQEGLVADSKNIKSENIQLIKDNEKVTYERNMMMYIKNSVLELLNQNEFTDVMLNSFKSIHHTIPIDELNIIEYDNINTLTTYTCKIEKGEQKKIINKTSVDNRNVVHDFVNQEAQYIIHNTLFEKNTEAYAMTHCYIKLSSQNDIHRIVEIRKTESGSITGLEEFFLIQFIEFLNVALNKVDVNHKETINSELSILEYYSQLYKDAGITKREFEIILKVNKGCSNKMIGTDLNISTNTVRNHLNSIFNKLDVKTRYELIVISNLGDLN